MWITWKLKTELQWNWNKILFTKKILRDRQSIWKISSSWKDFISAAKLTHFLDVKCFIWFCTRLVHLSLNDPKLNLCRLSIWSACHVETDFFNERAIRHELFLSIAVFDELLIWIERSLSFFVRIDWINESLWVLMMFVIIIISKRTAKIFEPQWTPFLIPDRFFTIDVFKTIAVRHLPRVLLHWTRTQYLQHPQERSKPPNSTFSFSRCSSGFWWTATTSSTASCAPAEAPKCRGLATKPTTTSKPIRRSLRRWAPLFATTATPNDTPLRRSHLSPLERSYRSKNGISSFVLLVFRIPRQCPVFVHRDP